MGLASTSTYSSCRLDRLQSIILDDPAWSCIAALVSGPLLNHFAQQQQHMARYFQLQDLVSANQFFPFIRNLELLLPSPVFRDVLGTCVRKGFACFPPPPNQTQMHFAGRCALKHFKTPCHDNVIQRG
jgi:hypothetical protein